MNKDLRMEMFPSKDIVRPTSLHVYKLHAQKIDNTFSVIRSAAGKFRSYYHIGVFEDGKRIYTTEEIDGDIPNADFTLEYTGLEELSVLDNRKVYCDLIRHMITLNLEKIIIYDKYRKYSCKSSITSKWIKTDQGFQTFVSQNKEINLERKYDFWIEILDNGKAYIRVNTGSIFTSKLTVSDYLDRGINPIGMEVKNDWSYNKQTGTLVEICDFTVTDPLDFADSLKAYYIKRKEGSLVEKIPDDTRAVKVRLQTGKLYPYYPQALKPVLTRERVGQIDPVFSRKIEGYVKRSMPDRVDLDIDFIRDIGVLSDLSDLEFSTETCTVEEMGYTKGRVDLPGLICGRNKVIPCDNKYKVFNYGFYRKPDREIRIGYIYPKNTYELMKAVVNQLYSFVKEGKYHGDKDEYITAGLLDVHLSPMIKEEYELGDMTDYKRAANRLQKVEGIDIVIALISDGVNDDGPYNPFKAIWAKANIPSQMISMKTAELIATATVTDTRPKYYFHNIVLGILGKTGGIPWIVKDMPGNVDCFVGLDVATVERGIHYPACSVVFDKYGRLLGFYKPMMPQQGEKITTRILQDIFDQVIFSYEDKFGESPKNVVIHRDGFSNENDEWYSQYFGAKGIEYSIIEVRKNIGSKLFLLEDNKIINPTLGYCIYNKNKAYLVTTEMKNKKGSPSPILIEKKCGDISMVCILKQILYLSQLHVGATQNMKLPITTGYADKICKNREFVPEGKMDDRLFFL